MAFMASRRKAAAKPTDNHSVQPFHFLISPFPVKSPPSLPLFLFITHPFLFSIFLFLFFKYPFLNSLCTYFLFLIFKFLFLYVSLSSLYLFSFYRYLPLSSFISLSHFCIFLSLLSKSLSLLFITLSLLLYALFLFYVRLSLGSTFSLCISPYFFYVSPFRHVYYNLYLTEIPFPCSIYIFTFLQQHSAPN
jgi:hypothetical protein